MGCLLKELFMIGFVGIVMMYLLEVCFCLSLSISMLIKSNSLWYLSLAYVSTLNFIPVSVVICTHLRASVLTFMNSL